MPTLDDLDKRIAKLETQNALKFFVQYLLSPLLIVAIGAWTNWHIERTRMEAQRVDLTLRTEAQRIDLAHKMLPSLWEGNPDLAFATERLMSRIVEKEFADEVHTLVAKYYKDRLMSDIQTGNVARATALVQSARAFGSPVADEVVGSVAESAKPMSIEVSAASRVEIIVEVSQMVSPYAVAYDGKPLIKSLVSRRESLELAPGTHLLSWTFAHTTKGWRHKLSISINGGAPQELDSKSEADKDRDHSVGFAQLVVS